MEIASFKLVSLDALSHSVLIIDGPSGEIVSELPLPPGFRPVDLAVHPVAQTVYIALAAQSGAGSLLLLNLNRRSLASAAPLIPHPAQFCLAPGIEQIYLADPTGSLYAFSLATSTLTVWDKPAGSGLCAGLASGRENLFGVWENAGGGTLAIYDHCGKILAEYPIGGIPTSLTLDQQGRPFVPFTANAFSGEGLFFLPAINQNDGRCAVVTIQCSCCCSVGRVYPTHVAVEPAGKLAYVACENNASIAVIDVDSARLSAIIPLGHSPSRLALLSDGKFAVASSNMFADLALIDLVNHRPLAFTSTSRELLSPLAVIE
ncbi:MAG: hypothetical protein P4N59_08950 [Negativicutes bacterium]|nr:hypothetical protein [Negativicutes bacterium]